jgi:hypothetical protein
MKHTAIRKIADIERREPQLYKEKFNQLSVDERCLILKGKKERLAYELYFNRVLLGGSVLTGYGFAMLPAIADAVNLGFYHLFIPLLANFIAASIITAVLYFVFCSDFVKRSTEIDAQLADLGQEKQAQKPIQATESRRRTIAGGRGRRIRRKN